MINAGQIFNLYIEDDHDMESQEIIMCADRQFNLAEQMRLFAAIKKFKRKQIKCSFTQEIMDGYSVDDGVSVMHRFSRHLIESNLASFIKGIDIRFGWDDFIYVEEPEGQSEDEDAKNR